MPKPTKFWKLLNLAPKNPTLNRKKRARLEKSFELRVRNEE
jgi:hypothetical protein